MNRYVTDLVVIVFLGLAMILALYKAEMNLAGSIMTGLLGYIGGNRLFNNSTENQTEKKSGGIDV